MVPIAIRGTRSILRGSDWLPHRGRIELHVTPPITAAAAVAGDTDLWETAVTLREAARKEILKLCGEPDLALQGPSF